MYECYKYYRNTLSRLIRQSNVIHYRTEFESWKNNSKKIWKGINELINRHKNKATNDISLKIVGKLVRDHKIIENEFNNYFTGIAKNLVSKVRKTNKVFSDYLNNPQENSFAVSPVLEVEVLDEINNLDESKAPESRVQTVMTFLLN